MTNRRVICGIGGMLAALSLGACVPVEKSIGDEAVAGGGGSGSVAGAPSANAGVGDPGNGGASSVPVCDPLAATTSAVSLLASDIVAAGVDEATSTTYVLSEHESSLRLFVTDGSGLLEHAESGTGQGTDGSLQFWTFQYIADQGPVTVEVDKDASGLRMGVATGTLAGKRFSVGDTGIVLTLIDANTAANMPARSHQTFHIEYSGSDTNGQIALVTAPDHASSFDGFRVFIGPTSAVQEQTVTGVTRGNSIPTHTFIDLLFDGSAASFRYDESGATLTTPAGTSAFASASTQLLPDGVVLECL